MDKCWCKASLTGLYIAVAPDTVTIKGPGTGRINETVTLECETSNANPASSIQWVVGGRILPAVFTRNDTSEEGGWVTKSNISILVTQADRNKDVSCYANNFALSTTKVQTHRIKVLCKFSEVNNIFYKTLIAERNWLNLQYVNSIVHYSIKYIVNLCMQGIEG